MPDDPNNTAWNRGYDAEPNARCPYDSPALFGWWIAGVTAAAQDHSAGRKPRWWQADAQSEAA